MSRRSLPQSAGISILVGLFLALFPATTGAVAATPPAAPLTDPPPCLALCEPPPETEVDPIHSILVLSVGWEASDPALSSPLHPGDQATYVDFLQKKVIPWFQDAAPGGGLGLTDVVAGGEYVIREPSLIGQCTHKTTTLSNIVIATDEKARLRGIEPFDYGKVVYQWTRQDCGGSEYILGENAVRSEVGLTSFGRTPFRALAYSNGLAKPHGLRCTNGSGAPVPYSDICIPEDAVGDPYDVTGSGQGPINAIEARNIAWLNSPEIANVPESLASQTITIKPWSQLPHGLRAIKVTDGGFNYWLEYRAATGLDAQVLDPNVPSVVPGLLIHREDKTPPPQGWLFPGSSLLDMSPSSDPASFRDAGLPVGQTWANPLGTMRVTLDSAGAAGATVTISSQLAKVPNLAGLKLAQARPALEAAGFAYGGVSEELDASCEFIGVVKSATPDFGSVVSRGTSVALHLGKEDPKHRCF